MIGERDVVATGDVRIETNHGIRGEVGSHREYSTPMDYVPYVAILAAVVLIYAPRIVVGREMKKQAGGYNNHDPRAQQAQLDGVGRRAVAAHQNAIEAFPPFAVGVLMAAQRGADVYLVVVTCIVFVVARTGFMFAYLADKASLRSGLWGIGLAATGVLMISAIIR